MLEHCHFKNLSYTEFRRRGGAAEAVTIFNHLIACLDFFCISYKIQHAAKGQTVKNKQLFRKAGDSQGKKILKRGIERDKELL